MIDPVQQAISKLNKRGYILLSCTQEPASKGFLVEITNAKIGDTLKKGVNMFSTDENDLHPTILSALKDLSEVVK